MDMWDHVWLGVLAVLHGPALFHVAGIPFPSTLVMVAAGLLTGIVVGATPGLAGPMAMAVSLPILISAFGYEPDALLPVMGFLIGIMKGATVGGAVPAILFNTPGTPDALLTTYDGHPMARTGRSGEALRVAHLASVSGDTFSDLVLFVCAPFLAVLVERYLDLPEKTALIILSLAFVAAVVGTSVAKGLLATGLGILVACIGTGEDFYPRLSLDVPGLARGFPAAAVILGVLILGEVFKSLEDLMRERVATGAIRAARPTDRSRMSWAERRRLLPYIVNSAVIGTAIGALPGIGSTLAATLGYASGKRMHARSSHPGPAFGEGVPEGVAATEAANSAVAGANLIPVLSLGIPGNAAAVFLILATESIGGFNPGPSVFRLPADGVNAEMVLAFGIFTAMVFANLLNWTIGGVVMRSTGVMARAPKQIVLPCVLLVTLTAIYLQETREAALWITVAFGVLGYLMRRLDIPVLPFVIAFILTGTLETIARQAFAATGSNPLFLFASPMALALICASVVVVVVCARNRATSR